MPYDQHMPNANNIVMLDQLDEAEQQNDAPLATVANHWDLHSSPLQSQVVTDDCAILLQWVSLEEGH